MESMETKLLNKYNIPNLFPAQWPEDKDRSSDEEDEAPRTRSVQPVRRSKSRYSVLESAGSFRQKLPGAEKSKDGVENLVQKDENDPLGTYPSVVQVLRQRGLPVEEDVKLSAPYSRSEAKGMIYIDLQAREPLPPKLNHLLALSLPLAGPQRCIHRLAPRRPRLPLALH